VALAKIRVIVAHNNLTEITANIVCSYVGTNRVSADELPDLIRMTYAALDAVASGTARAAEPGGICSDTSRASTIPAACAQPWATSAQPKPSVTRPNPVHFFGGGSTSKASVVQRIVRSIR
jgi:hypothetical protein